MLASGIAAFSSYGLIRVVHIRGFLQRLKKHQAGQRECGSSLRIRCPATCLGFRDMRSCIKGRLNYQWVGGWAKVAWEGRHQAKGRPKIHHLFGFRV